MKGAAVMCDSVSIYFWKNYLPSLHRWPPFSLQSRQSMEIRNTNAEVVIVNSHLLQSKVLLNSIRLSVFPIFVSKCNPGCFSFQLLGIPLPFRVVFSLMLIHYPFIPSLQNFFDIIFFSLGQVNFSESFLCFYLIRLGILLQKKCSQQEKICWKS